MSAEAVAQARLRLHLAHTARAEAQRVLDAASEAVDRARDFAVAARDRCAAVEEETRDLAIDRSISIRNAILAGEVPSFDEPSPTLTANALAAKELEHRAAAAEIAQADLEAAESEAMRRVTAAEDAVRQAAEALMLAEANDIAEAIERLENEALELRTALGGGSYAPIAVRGQPLTPALMRVFQTTDRMAEASIGDFAGRLHGPMRAAGRSWLRYIDELVERPDAELSFDKPPAEEDKAKAA
jgi:hypothetical protein